MIVVRRCNGPVFMLTGLIFTVTALAQTPAAFISLPQTPAADHIEEPHRSMAGAEIMVAPLINEHVPQSKGRAGSGLNLLSGSACVALRQSGSWQLMRISGGDLYGRWYDGGAPYTLSMRTRDASLELGGGAHKGIVSFAAMVGRTISADGFRTAMIDSFRAAPFHYLPASPWSICARFDVQPDTLVGAYIEGYAGPMHLSTLALAKTADAGLRSFPLALNAHTLRAGASLTTTPIKAGIEAASTRILHGRYLYAENAMPSSVEIIAYHGSFDLSARVGIIDSLWMRGSCGVAGGWIDNHNLSEHGVTFFSADSLRLRWAALGAGAALPHAFSAGLLANGADVTCPRGWLKLSALSAWSIFRSLDYRFENIHARYWDAGGFIGKKFTCRALGFDAQLNGRYCRTYASGSYREKRIIILVPVYGSETSGYAWNAAGCILGAQLGVTIRLHGCTIGAHVDQMVPFMRILLDTNGDSGQQQSGSADIGAFFTGGTIVRLGFTCPLARAEK
jgi:hypothetical protein